MKIMLTGATGFVASHLIPELMKGGHELILTAQQEDRPLSFHPRFFYMPCDISRAADVNRLMSEARPDAIVHLGAISNVAKAEQERSRLSEVNVVGTHNLCAAASALPKIVFLFVSTALVYGGDEAMLICNETTPAKPSNAYGYSKLAAENVVKSFRSNNFDVYCVRPFNHIGPGQSTDFVCGAFARRILSARNYATIDVGNLNSERDFCDVRDVVRAYRRILELRPDQKEFVLGAGQTISIRSILEEYIRYSGKTLEVKIDSSLLRANDNQVKVADYSLAHEVLGWHPEYPINSTLREIYDEVAALGGG